MWKFTAFFFFFVMWELWKAVVGQEFTFFQESHSQRYQKNQLPVSVIIHPWNYTNPLSLVFIEVGGLGGLNFFFCLRVLEMNKRQRALLMFLGHLQRMLTLNESMTGRPENPAMGLWTVKDVLLNCPWNLTLSAYYETRKEARSEEIARKPNVGRFTKKEEKRRRKRRRYEK